MDSDLQNELASRFKFSEIVKRFEIISTNKNLEKKKQIVGNFFKEMLKIQTQVQDEKGPDTNCSFYPFLRLFIPKLDLERGSFGIQTSTLGRLFVGALAINTKSTEAVRLTNLHGNTSDYGDIVFDVMKDRSPKEGNLSVDEVNRYLDLIAEHFKQNERKKIDSEMVRMLSGMSALDRKWLTRILLKKLNLGVGQKYILQLYHPKSWDLYNQYSHLSRVCEVIESKVPIETGIIEIFKPIRPMLCERGYISQINQMLSANDYYFETKMDGERCQLHVKGNEFKYFSRSCKDDMTNIFGENSTTGLYSPFLYHQLNGSIQDAIFDGEIMVWDREDDIYLKKAENVAAKHLKQNDYRLRPCYCIYDLIYLNGECLIEKPYAERIRKLRTIVREQHGSLMFCERMKIRDADHFLDCLNKAYDANEEGVVIKQEDSKYRPGTREKGGWYKMKPDYENNLISDFDLIIIGGYYNDKRTVVDSFLMAVLKKSFETESDKFFSVCRIRNGLKRSQFAEILGKIRPFQHEVRKNDPNLQREAALAGLELGNAIPDFWIDPKKIGIVLQMKASEMTETTTYRTSHSFRFPRVIEIRWDKMWYDACTLGEFTKFCSSNLKVEKLSKRQATSNDLIGNVPKRQKLFQKDMPSTSNQAKQVEVVDNVCQGLDFCIVNCDKKAQPQRSVDELKDMVRRHGGKVVEFPNSKTYVIIAGNPNTVNVKKFVNKKENNIAKPQWLVRALGSDKPLASLIKFTPNDMVFATAALQEEFAVELDAGDETYTEPLDIPIESTNENEADERVIDDIFQVESTIVGNEPRTIEEEIAVDEEAIARLNVDVNDHQNNQSMQGDHTSPNALINDPYLMDTQLIENGQAGNQDVVTNEEPVNDEIVLSGIPVIDEEPVSVEVQSDAPDEVNTKNDHLTLSTNKHDERDETDEDDNNEMNIFRRHIAYFYRDSSSDDIDITFAQFMFIGRGGTCLESQEDVQESSARLTHIFVTSDDFDRNQFKQTIKSFGTEKLENINVIRLQWVLDCDEQKKKICDKLYRVEL